MTRTKSNHSENMPKTKSAALDQWTTQLANCKVNFYTYS
jgi:hypothetical protein